MRRNVLIVIALAVAGCAALDHQKAQPPKPDTLEFHNLKVLPPNISHDELIATMRGFSRALGTRCEHCHVQTATEPRPKFDFPSDAKPEKQTARMMIRMVRAINGDTIAKLPEHDPDAQPVSCGTCHRGRIVPEPWTAPEPTKP